MADVNSRLWQVQKIVFHTPLPYPLALTLFFPPLSGSSLSLGVCAGVVVKTDGQFQFGHSGLMFSTVSSYTLSTDCFPLQKNLLWPRLRAAQADWHKNKYKEGNLTAWQFSKIIETVSILGSMTPSSHGLLARIIIPGMKFLLMERASNSVRRWLFVLQMCVTTRPVGIFCLSGQCFSILEWAQVFILPHQPS